MGKRVQGIFGSLPILAAAFGRRQGVKVFVGGNIACTDGRVIRLPDLPLDCDETLEVKAMGYLFHETGHIEFTDFTTYATAGDAFEANLLNVVEDIRMESMRNATYPGSAASLSKLVGVVAAEGDFGTEEMAKTAEPQNVLMMGVLTRLRSQYLGQPCDVAAAIWWPKLQALLGRAASIKLEALLGCVDDLDTTADALALARRIKTLVEEAAKDEPQEPSDPSQPGDPQQREGDASGQGGQPDAGGDQSARSNPDADAASSSDAQGSTGDAQAGPDRQALSQALGAGASDFVPTDLGKVLGASLEQEARKGVEAEARQLAKEGVRARPVTDPLAVSKRRAQGQGELQQVLGQSQQLRTRLAAAMEAQARAKVDYRRQGARLDGRVLHRLFTGDMRVFARKEVARKVNTAVQILLDRSGSMNGTPIEIARKATLATAVGISQIVGCKAAAAAFPAIEVLKEFDEAARGVAGRFDLSAAGGTPMGRAMIWAASQLVSRREERKLLVVITDGEPEDVPMVKRLAGKFAQSGVEVIGVGIGSGRQAVERLFPSAVGIDAVDELAGALFGVIHKKMRRVA
ncbi:cobaltochelatase CobT-related protein [Rhodanobacter denitrificans]|uniref:Nicotinate-mononucleotide:5, 6-dimethylbenzimidazole phosphoribosyltransferase CobT n=1 Tax=Rhodanobacter denitrificans TaxID=666685 RepID=M4NH99_9GAMM|nr:VWA domain-containing protein [Rhodanobacter denitrificans]AGG89008.1 nicotinate-mononucleotide:5,6-dimethylbenzimidazole phosphoribosyltransferase CobT [Rhodanobacter denitrificans]UJJ53037.1 VWA domain-containing protein [Rhodanobacter denitrificans]